MCKDIKNTKWPELLFITGIGTDVGKSYSTGWLARQMRDAGINVITQKFIQTGNKDISEDIEVHRKIMGIEMQEEDTNHLTAPVIFTYPASPDLAARIDNSSFNPEISYSAAQKLLKTYSNVLIEGAGGVMVPFSDNMLAIDFLAEKQLPTAVVVNGQLGSINHSLLTLYALKNAHVPVFAVIYNPYFDKDEIICADTRKYLQSTLQRDFPGTIWIEQTAH